MNRIAMHLYRGDEWVATVTHDWLPGIWGECCNGEHTTVTGPERRRIRRQLVSWVPPGPQVPGSPWQAHSLPVVVMGGYNPRNWGHVLNRLAMGSLPGVYDRFEVEVIRGPEPHWIGGCYTVEWPATA